VAGAPPGLAWPDAGLDPDRLFIGRSIELGMLQAELDQVRRGARRVVVIHGEAGIGKTSLVRRFLSTASTGQLVVQACGEEEERSLGFGVIGQLLTAVAGQDAHAPAGSAVWSPSAVALPRPEADLYVVGADLARQLAAAAPHVPGAAVLVVLDDAHLSDEPSVRCLLFTLRRLITYPVLCVVTTRPDPGAHRWRRLASQRGRFLSLGGLQSREIGELATGLGRPVSHGVAERLHAHTGGNPLWLCNLLPGLPADHLDVAAADLVLPRELSSAITARHAALSPPARQLLSAASVLGTRFDVTTAADVAGIADPVDALEEAGAAELIQQIGGTPPRYRFAHPLLRAAIYEDLGPTTRTALHRAAHARTAGARSLLHLAAASLGTCEAVAAPLEAGGADALATGEALRAAELFDEAVRLTTPGAALGRRALLAMDAWLSAGDVLRARTHLGLAEQFGQDPLRAYVLGVLARSELRVDDATRHLEAVIGATDLLAGEALGARAAVELAMLAVERMAPTEAMDLADRALMTLGESPLRHLARCVRAVGLGMGGRAEVGLADLDRGPAHAVELHELVGRGVLELWTDDLEGAYRDLSVAHQRADAGEPLSVVQPVAYLADTCYRMGKLAEAARHAELACAITEAAERSWDGVIVHTRAGYVAAARGDFAEAAGHADAIAALATRLAGGDEHGDALRASVVAASGVAVAVALARDDPDGLLEAAQAAEGLNAHAAEPGMWAFGPTLAEALVGVGRLKEAAASLAAFSDRADQLGRRSAQLQAHRVRGLLVAAEGRYEDACRHFEEGLEVGRLLSLPLELGRLRLSYGRALARTGAEPAARRELMAAHELCVATGAHAYRAQVERALAELGLDATASARRRLTDTELTVASLVAQHLSNPEIASTLSMARKTVEFHLSNIYGKLGLTGRRELAALAAHWPEAPPATTNLPGSVARGS